MTILINDGIEFNIRNLSDSVENDFSNATDLADYLVGKDVPFRTAYQVVGELVKYCLERKILLKNFIEIARWMGQVDAMLNLGAMAAGQGAAFGKSMFGAKSMWGGGKSMVGFGKSTVQPIPGRSMAPQ